MGFDSCIELLPAKVLNPFFKVRAPIKGTNLSLCCNPTLEAGYDVCLLLREHIYACKSIYLHLITEAKTDNGKINITPIVNNGNQLFSQLNIS